MASDSGIYERKTFPSGKVVFRAGEIGKEAYLVQSGKLVVFVADSEGKETILGELSAGDIFCEMSLIADEPRMASVRTLTESGLIVISRKLFLEKLERSDPTLRAIVKMLTGRLQNMNKKLAGSASDLDQVAQTIRSMIEKLEKDLPHAQKRTFQNTIKTRA